MPRDNLYLVEIVEAIDRISRWLSGIDADGWDNDDMLGQPCCSSSRRSAKQAGVSITSYRNAFRCSGRRS